MVKTLVSWKCQRSLRKRDMISDFLLELAASTNATSPWGGDTIGGETRRSGAIGWSESFRERGRTPCRGVTQGAMGELRVALVVWVAPR
jgi:hypothetical protein